MKNKKKLFVHRLGANTTDTTNGKQWEYTRSWEDPANVISWTSTETTFSNDYDALVDLQKKERAESDNPVSSPWPMWVAVILCLFLAYNCIAFYGKYRVEEKKREILAGIMAKKMLLVWTYAYQEGLLDKYKGMAHEWKLGKDNLDSLTRGSLEKFRDRYLDQILQAPIKEDKDVKTHEKNWN